MQNMDIRILYVVILGLRTAAYEVCTKNFEVDVIVIILVLFRPKKLDRKAFDNVAHYVLYKSKVWVTPTWGVLRAAIPQIFVK